MQSQAFIYDTWEAAEILPTATLVPQRCTENCVTSSERVLPSCVKCVFVMESLGVKLSDSKGPRRRLCSGAPRQHSRLVFFPLKKPSFHPRTQHCDTHDEGIWTTLTFNQVLSGSRTKKDCNSRQPTFIFFHKPLRLLQVVKGNVLQFWNICLQIFTVLLCGVATVPSFPLAAAKQAGITKWMGEWMKEYLVRWWLASWLVA